MAAVNNEETVGAGVGKLCASHHMARNDERRRIRRIKPLPDEEGRPMLASLVMGGFGWLAGLNECLGDERMDLSA